MVILTCFVICGYVGVGLLMCGCVCMGSVMWVCVGVWVGFVMCGCFDSCVGVLVIRVRV